MLTIKNWYYTLTRPLREIKYIPKKIKWFIQRGIRGWSDSDAWDIANYLDTVIPQMLNRLRKVGHGYNDKFTPEGWDLELQKLEECFTNYQKHDEDFPYHLERIYDDPEQWWGRLSDEDQIVMDNWDKELERLFKEKVKGRKLLVKYWDHLWD